MRGIVGFFHQDSREEINKGEKWHQKIENMQAAIGAGEGKQPAYLMTSQVALGYGEDAQNRHSGEREPLTRRGVMGTATIVFYGQLFYQEELRKILPREKGRINSQSAELALQGYLTYGTAIFQKLRGSFALAIYDHTRRQLILARDPLGTMPLYYTHHEDTLVFATQVKALFAYGVKPACGDTTFQEIFGLGPGRTPGNTLFEGISEVLPGHFLTSEHKGVGTPYWQLAPREHKESYEETVDHVKTQLLASVKEQLGSEEPVCTFLSGGLDSSLVTAICAADEGKKKKLLDTYAFQFVGSEAYFQANAYQGTLDAPYVAQMVAHLGTNHRNLYCDNDPQIALLSTCVEAKDAPGMADIESSMMYFCKEVSKHHSVALTGECADEIFGGYPWFYREELLAKRNFPWSDDMAARESCLRDEVVRKLGLEAYTQAAYEKTIASTPCLDCSQEERRSFEISWLNLNWFMMTLLNRMERAANFAGIEARVPFADVSLIEYVYSIPKKYKYRNNQPKAILVEIGKEYLPKEVLYRKKSPYPKTYDPAYEKRLKEKLMAVLRDGNAPLHELVDRQKCMAYMESAFDYGKPWYGQLMSGPQMLAYLLQVNHWMEKYQIIPKLG